VPAVVTLGVTLLRLVGELQGWSPALFSREAGGGGALVGISWLVLVFGAWFGWKLARAGSGPASIGRALLVMLAAILGNWGTHYDVMPPGAPPMEGLTKWFMIGVVPQLTIWMAFTVVIGGLFGIVAAAIARRRPASA
jgi:hypothetical protein